MVNWKEKYEEQRKFLIIVMIINVLTVIYFSMNVKMRNERIWELTVENEDLKDRISVEEKN